MGYSKTQLKELLNLATKLGYDDDVIEWTAQLKELENK